jgi:Fur family transcriptional regulator, ferric uptake regulator
MKKILETASLKNTKPRLAVLSAFEKSRRPLTASDIEETLIREKVKADTATIYRILETFEKNGILKKIYVHEDKLSYELTSLPHHHHLVCTSCGTIQGIAVSQEEKLIKDFQKTTEFKIKSHSLEFFGLCKNCKNL